MSKSAEHDNSESANQNEYLQRILLLAKDAALGSGYTLLAAVIVFYNYLLITETLDEDLSDLPFYMCCLIPSLLIVVGGGLVVRSEIRLNHAIATNDQSEQPLANLLDRGKSPGRMIYEQTEQLLNELLAEVTQTDPDQESVRCYLDELSEILFALESQPQHYNSGLWYYTIFKDLKDEKYQPLKEYFSKQPLFVHLTTGEYTEHRRVFSMITAEIETILKKIQKENSKIADIDLNLKMISEQIDCFNSLPDTMTSTRWKELICTELEKFANQPIIVENYFIHTVAHQWVANLQLSELDTTQTRSPLPPTLQ